MKNFYLLSVVVLILTTSFYRNNQSIASEKKNREAFLECFNLKNKKAIISEGVVKNTGILGHDSINLPVLLSFDAITTYQFENDTMEFKIELKQKTYSTIEYEYTIQWRWYSVKLYQKGEADIDCSFYNEYLNNTQAGQLPFKSIQYIDSKNLDLVRIKIGTDSDKVKFSVGTSNFDQEPILKKKMGKN